jgi:ActR/RegA family two-component response regulator
MDDYLSKPTRIDDLAAALARLRETAPTQYMKK